MLMAEIISSAVVQETVSQIVSGLVDKYEGKLNANENLERLEMAHIKLVAALEISDKWRINDASLMRWRKKLKRSAQECDETLRKCKQRIPFFMQNALGQMVTIAEYHKQLVELRQDKAQLCEQAERW